MDSALVQLLVLAGIAVFLILRLRNVLGTREGFEKPPVQVGEKAEPIRRSRRDFEVIEGGPDRDIVDHVPEGSDQARALAQMKAAEPDFSVSEFLRGARGAYEMILMAFERGTLEDVRQFLSDDVYEAFDEVVQARRQQGLTIDATFVGLREIAVQDATFEGGEAEISVRFLGELTWAARSSDGTVVEGSTSEIKRQKDIWTFARHMGEDDPNWQLVATGE